MKELNYEFRKELLQVHKPQRVMPWAKPTESDVLVDGNWSIYIPDGSDQVLYNAARDLEDYFAVSMDTFIPVVKTASEEFQISYVIDPSLKEREYRIIAEEKSIKLVGPSSKNCARAGYCLEDLMNLNEAPFIKKQTVKREYMYSPRMVHSGFGLDMYPDNYLKAIAHAGIDAILIFVTGIDTTPHGYHDFNDIIYRASLYGIDTYCYSRFWNRMYPEGEEAYKFYDNIYGNLFRRCPGFKGIIFVGESCEFPSKDPHTTGMIRLDNKGPDGKKLSNKLSPGWWPCYDYPLLFKMISDIIRKEKPDCDIVMWTYNWGGKDEAARLSLLENMPKDITLEATFEMFMSTKRDGVTIRPDDYSTFFEGPGDYFVSEAKKAKELGLKLYSMTNTGGLTWDLGVVPYEPGPYQWLKRFKEMRKAHDNWGLCGLMESHHYGWTPSFISDFSKVLFESPDSDPDTVLRDIAKRDFSLQAADTVMEAYRLLSEAQSNLISSNNEQYGPLRVGPAFPLLVFKNEFVFKSEDFAFFGKNKICFPMYPMSWPENMDNFYAQIEWHNKAIELYDQAADLLEGILDTIHPSKQRNAKKLIGLARFFANSLRTTVNVKLWAVEKKKLSSSDKEEVKAAAERMMEIAQDEIENAKNTIPLVEFDSRLGYEPSMEYMCDAQRLILKIKETERAVEEELKPYLN